MRILCLVLVIGLAAPAYAQDCTPVPHRYLAWGNPGERIVWGEVVPAGEVWELESGGVATTDNRVLTYMGQHYVPPGWYVPLASPIFTGSTPVLAFPRGLILSAGERIGGRVNAPDDFATMAVIYKVFVYPEACLARLKGVAAATTTAGGSVALPDFTAFVAALNVAATALQNAAAAVP